MARVNVTVDALQEWITAQLNLIEGCEKCSVGGIVPLQEPDSDGCNWSDGAIVNTAHVPVDFFRPHLIPIMIEARARFNIV